MQIIEPYYFLDTNTTAIIERDVVDDPLMRGDIFMDDPDQAFEYWVKQDFFESSDKFLKDDLIKQMSQANQVQLNLQKENRSQFSVNIMKQHSIQINLFEALVINEVFNGNKVKWQLDMGKFENQLDDFWLNSDEKKYHINLNRNNNKIIIKNNNTILGTLSIDFEQQVIEKIYGKFNKKQFIIDPIWKHSQTTIDAVKLFLGDISTELVHHPKHKDTIWYGNNTLKKMTLKNNMTIQINSKLFLNKKTFILDSLILQSLQWFCPYQRFAILGNYYVGSN